MARPEVDRPDVDSPCCPRPRAAGSRAGPRSQSWWKRGGGGRLGSKRVQFHPGLMPRYSRQRGASMRTSAEGAAFASCPAGVHSNSLMADEINRASPRTPIRFAAGRCRGPSRRRRRGAQAASRSTCWHPNPIERRAPSCGSPARTASCWSVEVRYPNPRVERAMPAGHHRHRRNAPIAALTADDLIKPKP